jgi:Tfp pilus assembly protein FimV
MVGTVISVRKEKFYRHEKQDGKFFAIEDEKTILEVEGEQPEPMHFFINADACTIVENKSDFEKREAELAKKNAEIKKKNKDLAEANAKAQSLKKKKSKKSEIKPEVPAEVEYEKDENGKLIKEDMSDMNDFSYHEEVPSPGLSPAVTEQKKELATPEPSSSPVSSVPMVLAPSEVKPVEKDIPTPSPTTTPEKKSEKDSGLKGVMKDILNGF